MKRLCSGKDGCRIDFGCRLLVSYCFSICSFVAKAIVVAKRYFEPILCFCIVVSLRWDFGTRIDRWLDSGLGTGASGSFGSGCRPSSSLSPRELMHCCLECCHPTCSTVVFDSGSGWKFNLFDLRLYFTAIFACIGPCFSGLQ